MERDRALDQLVKKTETDRGKRIVTLVAAVVVLAALMAVVAFGFRGRRISENAAALAEPVTPVNVEKARPLPATPPR